MKFLPEVGAGTRILKVKLPGFDNVRILRKKDPRESRAEGPSARPEGPSPTLPDEIEHPNPMIMNSTGFLPLRAQPEAPSVTVSVTFLDPV